MSLRYILRVRPHKFTYHSACTFSVWVASLLLLLLTVVTTGSAQESTFKVVVQSDHTSTITAILHSARTHQVITASNDNLIRVWSSNSGQEFGRLLHILQGHHHNVTAIGIQPEGKNLVSGSRDGTVMLWNLFTGELESSAPVGENVVAVTYSDDPYQNSVAVALEREKSIHFFDATKTLRESSTIDIPRAGGDISAMLGYDSWQHLACGTSAGEIIVLDIPTKRTLRIHSVSSSKIMSIGRLDDQTLVWIDEAGMIGRISISRQDATDEPWKPLQLGKLLTATFNAEEKIFSIVSNQGTVISVDPLTRRRSSFSNQTATCAIAIESGNMVVGTRTGKLQWLSRAGMRELPTPSGSNSIPRAVAAGAHSLATLNQNYDVWVWDYLSGTCGYYPLPEKSGAGYHLSYNSAGDILAIGIGSSNASVLLLTQDSLLPLGTSLSAVTALEFIPGTNRLISLHANGTMNMWNADTRQLLLQIHTTSPQLSLSVSSRWVITTDKHMIYQWNTSTLSLLDSVSSNDRSITTCQWDTTSNSLAIGYSNGDIGIRSNTIHSIEQRCVGHTDRVNKLRWIHDPGSPRRRLLVSCSKDNSTRLWSSDGKPVRVSTATFTNVWDVDIVPLNNYIATINNDGTCVLMDPANLLPVIKLVTIGRGQWIAVSPEGYFDASSSGVGAVNIVRDNHSLPLENYISVLEKPGILSRCLGARADAPAAMVTLASSKKIPTIRILSPAIARIFDTEELLLTFELTNIEDTIYSIRISNNGSPQLTIERSRVRDFQTVPIHLFPGKNLLRVVCVSADGVEYSDTLSVLSNQRVESKPNLYVIAVGVSTYKNNSYNLKYAENDAKSLSLTLKNKFSQSEYSTVTVRQLMNEQATVTSIVAAFVEVATVIRPNDRFIFYFAGHGALTTAGTNQDFYLITHEIESMSAENLLRQSGLSTRRLQALFLNIKCEKKALILDACHAGALTTTLAEEQSGATKFLRQLPRNSGVYLMSSALSSQSAREVDSLQHGIFTTALLEGLNGRAASLEDRQISLTSLQDYIQKRVKKLKTELQINQTPIFRSDDTDGFILTQL